MTPLNTPPSLPLHVSLIVEGRENYLPLEAKYAAAACDEMANKTNLVSVREGGKVGRLVKPGAG